MRLSGRSTRGRRRGSRSTRSLRRAPDRWRDSLDRHDRRDQVPSRVARGRDDSLPRRRDDGLAGRGRGDGSRHQDAPRRRVRVRDPPRPWKDRRRRRAPSSRCRRRPNLLLPPSLRQPCGARQCAGAVDRMGFPSRSDVRRRGHGAGRGGRDSRARRTVGGTDRHPPRGRDSARERAETDRNHRVSATPLFVFASQRTLRLIPVRLRSGPIRTGSERSGPRSTASARECAQRPMRIAMMPLVVVLPRTEMREPTFKRSRA